MSLPARIGITLLACNVAGCALLKDIAPTPTVPNEIKVKHPTSLPNPVITNFNEAIACMDDLMLINQVTPIFISSPPITNYTSDRSISSGGTEMLITALSKMAIRSGGVRYVSFGPDVQNVLSLQGAHPDSKSFRAPDFFIRGGLTEFNKSMWTAQNGAGFSAMMNSGQIVNGPTFFLFKGQEDFTKSISRDNAFGTLTMDLNAGFISNLQMIPGVASSNTLALENKSSTSITGDLSVRHLGLSYSMSENVTQDFNQILRSLIQVGAIEIVGKLQGVPYWRCLANAGMVEERDRELRDEFINRGLKDESALIRSAQTALKELRYYDGAIHGKLDPATQEALQTYQQHMGLLATGLLGFETFRMLNIYTPARTKPYVAWWQNHNLTELGVTTPPVSPPLQTAPPAVPVKPPGAKAEPTKPTAMASPAAAAGEPQKAETPLPPKTSQTQQALPSNMPMQPSAEALKKLGPITQRHVEESLKWLAETSSSRWFVQLIRTDSSQAKRVEAFLGETDKLLDPSKVKVYFVDLHGSERLGVIYGDYATYAEVKAAIGGIPKALSEYRPYARQVGYLR